MGIGERLRSGTRGSSLPPGTGYAGGYCMSTCEQSGAWGGVNGCGPSGICLNLGSAASPFNSCIGTCSNPGLGRVTRPGGGAAANQYSCFSLRFADGGATPFGYVYPGCDAPPVAINGCAFAAGSACNTTSGYCCFTDGGCIK